MNLGDLLDQADEALGAAVAGMEAGPGPANTLDVLTAITARSNVYSGLARCVEAVSGGTLTINRQLADLGSAQAVAVSLLGVRGQQTNKLYAGLRAAAAAGGHPPGTSANTPASRNLLRAADLVGAASDLLAGHVPADQPPRSPEGAAIRVGGAIREGLAAIARLTHQAIQVDARLGAWFGRGRTVDGTFADQYGPALQPATWTVASGLDELARQLMASANGKPNLGLLAPASPAVLDTPAASTDPAARFRAVRDWLRRNPTNIDARHLRAGTQLGLAIALLTGEPRRAPWRAAAASLKAQEQTAWKELRAARDLLVPLGAPPVREEDLRTAWAELVGWAEQEVGRREVTFATAQAALAAAEHHRGEKELALGRALGQAGIAVSPASAADTVSAAVAAELERARANVHSIEAQLSQLADLRSSRAKSHEEHAVASTLGGLLRSNEFPAGSWHRLLTSWSRTPRRASPNCPVAASENPLRW